MKQILLAYLFVSLLGIAALSLLSYGHGPGYVYLYWRNWQVQTSLWVLAALLVIISFVIHMLWYTVMRYLNREQRKKQRVFSFNHLHP